MRLTFRGVATCVAVLFVATWLLVAIYASWARDESYLQMVAAGYDATIEPTYQVVNVLGGKETILSVTCRNAGIAVWGPKRNGHAIGLGMFRQTLLDKVTNREGHGSNPQWRAHPVDYYCGGGRWEATIRFTPPSYPGTYRYRLQMVDEVVKTGTDEPESGRWFGDIVEVTVVVPEGTVSAAQG